MTRSFSPFRSAGKLAGLFFLFPLACVLDVRPPVTLDAGAPRPERDAARGADTAASGAPAPPTNAPDATTLADAGAIGEAAPDVATDATAVADALAAPDGLSAADTRAPDATAPGSAQDAAVDRMPIDTAPLASLAQGLILFLPLDDGPSSIAARDESGHKQDVAFRGIDPEAAWVPGKTGLGLTFRRTAATGWLRVAASKTINDISESLSIAAWLNRPVEGDGAGAILSRRALGAGGFLYNFQVSGDRLRIELHSANGYRLDLASQIPLPRGVWTHVAVTYDLASVRLFIDGQPAGTAAFRLPLPPDNSPVVVGASQATAAEVVTQGLGSVLDDVLLYSRALKAEEVAALARGTRAR